MKTLASIFAFMLAACAHAGTGTVCVPGTFEFQGDIQNVTLCSDVAVPDPAPDPDPDPAPPPTSAYSQTQYYPGEPFQRDYTFTFDLAGAVPAGDMVVQVARAGDINGNTERTEVFIDGVDYGPLKPVRDKETAIYSNTYACILEPMPQKVVDQWCPNGMDWPTIHTIPEDASHDWECSGHATVLRVVIPASDAASMAADGEVVVVLDETGKEINDCGGQASRGKDHLVEEDALRATVSFDVQQ